MRFYVKVGGSLVVIGALGAAPAWIIDQWIWRLSPVVSLLLSVAGIVGLLMLVNFDQLVRQWRGE